MGDNGADQGEGKHVSIPIRPVSVASTTTTSSSLKRRSSLIFQDDKRVSAALSGTLADPSVRLNVTWYQIKYRIPKPLPWKDRIRRREPTAWKEILRSVSGQAKPGETIGIMGASGAGKSTLLNVLAGRIGVGEITGTIRVNGKPRADNWKRVVAYVEQDDIMYRTLTVRETITFAANLKLPGHLTKEQRKERVDAVMTALGLMPVADTIIGDQEHRGVSGGERKRVSIGIELITDPRLIFLDEPTSGLDSFTAMSVIETLTDLATQDRRTILMTIHQPRANILRLFSKILLLSQGKIIFYGSIGEAIDHFRGQGLPCPTMENPADFFLDQITVDLRDPEAREVSQARVNRLHAAWEAIENERLDEEVRRSGEQSVVQPTEADSERRKRKKEEWPTSWGMEFTYLMQRNFRTSFRDRQSIIATIVQTIVVFLLLGFVFFQLPDDFAGVQGRIGLLFFIPINMAFTIIQPLIVIFALDRAIILRERSSKTYRTSAAYLARFVSLLPLRAVLTIAFSAALYWLVGLRTDGFQYFLIFTGFLLLIALCSICLGLFIAATVPTVEVGQVIVIRSKQ